MPTSSVKTLVRELQEQSDLVKKDGVQRLLKIACNSFVEKDFKAALSVTTLAKTLRIPCEGVDQLRGLAFMYLGKYHDAVEAFKEELRWFPENKAALESLQALQAQLPPTQPTLQDADFLNVFKMVSPYTMVGPLRLQSLFVQAKNICLQGIEGNFVECGVAGGGSSGLLAWTLSQHDTLKRTLFCCDSFSGMPMSEDCDISQGIQAENTCWGAGTCSAPESSVQNICTQLHSQDKIAIVKGFFQDTLPVWKERMGKIAFLHMDGDWYSSTKDILDNLYDNLVPGAYVQVDDYGHWDGCRKALHEFEKKHNLNFELHTIDSTGVFFFKK